MSKIPKKLPTFIVKCSWRATAITLKVEAKDEQAAWDRAAKMVMRMEGGQGCHEIQILRRMN